ncbi:MAG: type II toxin-antitoxin system HicA family toxin [Dehalococcoidia bacterium]|nr:type II toxin-antitoxin system HicA family toxin [Dehalococcoidia bacterium]
MAAALQRAGFHLDRQRGSHLVFVQSGSNRTVVVPRHSELKPGTVRAILREAGLSREDVGR